IAAGALPRPPGRGALLLLGLVGLLGALLLPAAIFLVGHGTPPRWAAGRAPRPPRRQDARGANRVPGKPAGGARGLGPSPSLLAAGPLVPEASGRSVGANPGRTREKRRAGRSPRAGPG